MSVDNVEVTSTLKDLDIDSLDMVEIQLMCEERFELEIDNDDLSAVTAKDIILHIIGHIGTSGGTAVSYTHQTLPTNREL